MDSFCKSWNWDPERFVSLLCSQNQFALATEVSHSLSRAEKVSFMDSCTTLYMTGTCLTAVKMQPEIPHLKITLVYRIQQSITLITPTSGPVFHTQALASASGRAFLYQYEKPLLTKLLFYKDMSVCFLLLI